MQKSDSTYLYLSGSVLHKVNDYDCDIFKVHTCVGTDFGAVIAYHRVGAYFAFWSWVAGAVAGCRRRVLWCCCPSAVWVMELGCFAAAGVPLQGAASRCCRALFALFWSLVAGALQPLLVLLQWQASPGAVQGAELLFIFRLRFQDQKGLGGLVCLSASFRPRFGLVLAASFFAYATVAVVLRAA